MLSRILGRTKDPHDGEESKPVVAKMGTKNKMYYNAELKRWVMPGQEAAVAKESAARDAPPPETEGEPTPPTRPSGLPGRYPIPSFVKTKETKKLPAMLAYSHPLRPLPVADEAVPDAPENVPSANNDQSTWPHPPAWHAELPQSLPPPENLPQPALGVPEAPPPPVQFVSETPLQASHSPRDLVQPSELSQDLTQPSQTAQTLAEPLHLTQQTPVEPSHLSAKPSEPSHLPFNPPEPSSWDPETQYAPEGAPPMADWQEAGQVTAPQEWDPEAQREGAPWETESQPTWAQWQPTAPAAPAWKDGQTSVWTGEESVGGEWQHGLKTDGTTQEGEGSIGDGDVVKVESARHQAEAADACSVASRDIVSPRTYEREEGRRLPSTALPPLMPNSTRRTSADRGAPSLSEGTRQDDLHSSSGWESTRISQSNIHRASQRASSRKLYRNFASPSIGTHEYRKSRQPSPSVTGLLYHQRRSSSLNRPSISYDTSRSPPETPKQGHQPDYQFPDKASRTATMMSQYAPSVNGDSIRHLQHSRRSTLDTADPLTRVMHLRSARRSAVHDMPARKENEKKDLESMGLLEESLKFLSLSPEILTYISRDEANESVSQLLQMESVSDIMRSQLTKFLNLLKEAQEQSHLLKPTRLEQDFESIIQSLKLSQKSDIISQVRQLSLRFQDSAKIDLASTGLPTGDLFDQLSAEEEKSISQLDDCVRGLMSAVSKRQAHDLSSVERAGQWTAKMLRQKDERIAELEGELKRERNRAESVSRSAETETASRLREVENANSLLREQLAQTKEELMRAQQQSNESMRFLEGMQGLDEKQGDAERMQLEVEKNLLESELEEVQLRYSELENEIDGLRCRNDQREKEMVEFRRRVNEQLDQLLRQAALLDHAADQEIEELDQLRDNLLLQKTETETETALQSRIEKLTAQLSNRNQQEVARLEAELQKGSEELTHLAQVVLEEKEEEMDRLREANLSLQHAIDQLLEERQKETETRLHQTQQEELRRKSELEQEIEQRRSELQEEIEKQRNEKETEMRMIEESLNEREKELGVKSAWMESEVQKLAKYALALQSRSAAFSDWQEKALAASKVLQGRMRQLNSKVVTLNRQLAARGAPQIDLSQDLELEAARKFVEEGALRESTSSQEVESHETNSTLHPSSSEIISI